MLDASCERCGAYYDSDDCDKPCMGPTFYRQDRYEVFKWSDIRKLSTAQQGVIAGLLHSVRVLLDEAGVNPRECVVVESDWPMYGRTWYAIEAQYYREQLQARGKK